MKWLITGGCGFIGSALAARLAADGGHRLRVFDNLSVGRLEDLTRLGVAVRRTADSTSFPRPGDPVQAVVGDVTDREQIGTAAEGADVVVHLAAATGVMPSVADPISDCHSNVLGTLHALEAARIQGVPHFVFASSGAPLGEQEPPIDERKVPRPSSPYGASKLAGEGYCSAYARSFGIQTAALRFGNVYGPGSDRKESVVARFVKQAFAGDQITVYGDGRQTRDFIYVQDLVEAVVRAASATASGEVFQIAAGRETSINEIFGILSRLLSELAGISFEARHAAPRAGEVLRSRSDISKAGKLLGWRPRVAIEDGLRDTVRWFLEQRHTRQPSAASARQPHPDLDGLSS